MCRVLNVSRNGYYAHCRRIKDHEANAERKELIHLLKQLAQSSGNTYGRRRMRKALFSLGFNLKVHQVAKLMKEARIEVRYQKKYKVTTNSKHKQPVFDNLLKRKFEIAAPNMTYVADITYIWTQEGWLYLAVVIDLFSRKVVGWSMGSRMKATLVCDALHMAIWQRGPASGLIHHSDRGVQYASKEFRTLLSKNGIEGSMSRKGDCWDNAVAESFFGTLKQERVQWQNYQTRYEAQQDILNYITMFYNDQRLHSYLDYRSPNQFEQEMVNLKKVA